MSFLLNLGNFILQFVFSLYTYGVPFKTGIERKKSNVVVCSAYKKVFIFPLRTDVLY
jgi:hypothetical protein